MTSLPESLGEVLGSMRFPRPNPKAEEAKRKLEARKSTCSVLPGYEWVDQSACDPRALQAVRYHVGDGKPVFLYGNPGAGKTAIAAVIAMDEARRLGEEHDVDPSVFAPGIWMPATAIVSLMCSTTERSWEMNR